MQYGVILGKHLDISRAEIFAHDIQIEKHYENIALLADSHEVDTAVLEVLSGIVKRGHVIKTQDIEPSDLIGVSARELGTFLKKRGVSRRYKEIEPLHTDEEIKKRGTEYIKLDDAFEHVLHITHYQDISRFSLIDFDKPVNSMQIGMMPAKLTQVLLNIANGYVKKSHAGQHDKKIDGGEATNAISPLTVWDPFMWLGTTYMVANSLGYNVIGSDINITPAKQNLAWWKKQTIAQEKPITLFSHDVFESFSNPTIRYANMIVTEGWLGHIITAKTPAADLVRYSTEIEKLYTAWINNTMPLYEHMTIVCTIPHHVTGQNRHIDNREKHCETKGITVTPIKQLYSRAGQKVARRIVILQW